MYYLFLDDYRKPSQVLELPIGVEWVVVKSYKEFVNVIIDKSVPKYVSFDIDLSPEHYKYHTFWPEYLNRYKNGLFKEKTGLDCADYLIQHCEKFKIPLPEINCHSMNF